MRLHAGRQRFDRTALRDFLRSYAQQVLKAGREVQLADVAFEHEDNAAAASSTAAIINAVTSASATSSSSSKEEAEGDPQAAEMLNDSDGPDSSKAAGDVDAPHAEEDSDGEDGVDGEKKGVRAREMRECLDLVAIAGARGSCNY